MWQGLLAAPLNAFCIDKIFFYCVIIVGREKARSGHVFLSDPLIFLSGVMPVYRSTNRTMIIG